MIEDVVAVGELPDEVLLLCGKPSSAPSTWWTPSLVDLDDQQVERLLAATRRLLEDAGVRVTETGELAGLLGEVASVVAGARLLLLLETDVPGGPRVRRSVVVAEERALLDLQAPEEGLHDLLLAGPRATAMLVADLLAPEVVATARVRALAGVRTPTEVAAVLPEVERSATVRVIRSATGHAQAGDAAAGVHMLTVVAHPDGAVACWALPDATVQVQVLDEDAVVGVALALLGATLDGEVAA